MRFVFNGRVLRRGEQLSAAGIVSGSTIFVAKAARSAAPPALTNPTREEPWEIVERESPGAASTGLRRRLPTATFPKSSRGSSRTWITARGGGPPPAYGRNILCVSVYFSFISL